MMIGILKCGDKPPQLQDDFSESYGMVLETLMVKVGMSASDFMHFDIINASKTELPTLLLQAKKECSAYIISGSKYGIYDDVHWIAPLQKFIHDGFMMHQKTFIGICFGHQIMAQALGGTVEKSEKGWGYGLQHYPLCRDTHLFDDKDSLSLYAMHQDQIITPPPNTDIIASSEFCSYAALRYHGENGGRGFSLQAHPEFSYEYEAALIDMHRDEAGYWDSAQAQTHLDEMAESQTTDAPLIAKHIMKILTDKSYPS